MGGIEVVVELCLAGLLAATLVHAVRLQRAMGRLRTDRAALEAAVLGFASGTREAEAGVAALRQAVAETERQMQRAGALRDDLAYLADRGEGAADRLETLVKAGRAMETRPVYASVPEPPPMQAAPVPAAAVQAGPVQAGPKLRSQAERDLLAALQGRR